MSNITRTVADTGGFIPQVWAQRALDVLRANIIMAKLVSRDTDYDPGWQGKTLNIPFPGTFTAQEKAADTTATVQVPTGSSVPVTLNHHKYVDFIVEDAANAQANTNLLDRYVQPAAIAIAEAVEADLFALYTTITESIGTSGTDLTAATLRTAKKTLTDAKMPMLPRYLVLSTKDEVALLADASLASYFAFSRAQGIQDGSVGNLFGFQLFPSQLVPAVAGTPVSTKNIAFVPQAFILATRPFRDPPPQSGVEASTVMDPESGLMIRVLHSYSMGDRGLRVGFDILYGAAVLRNSAATVVLS